MAGLSRLLIHTHTLLPLLKLPFLLVAGEPVNAHSHLIAMLVGTSESIPVDKGEMKIGTYQNIIVVDADGTDGKKKRSIAVQVMGSK